VLREVLMRGEEKAAGAAGRVANRVAEHGDKADVKLTRFRGHLILGEREESTMPRTRPPYAAEFRQQMIELVRAGRSPAELSREFGCSATTITNWVGQANVGAVKSAPNKEALGAAEREELQRLRREVRELKVERDILAKATAWFARKVGTTPTSSSSS